MRARSMRPALQESAEDTRRQAELGRRCRMKITAALVREKEQPFSIEELELEEPRAGEILVRVAGVGVCHTDLIVRA